MQVELDALPPEILRELYEAAVREHWNPDAYEQVLEREAAERKRLSKVVASMKRTGGA
jgi:hypothetical protein